MSRNYKYFSKNKIQTRSRGFFLFLILITSILLGLSIISAADNSEKFPASLPAPPLNSLVVDSNTPEYVIIRPSDQATFSSETIASIANIAFKEGSSFHTGDVLLQFDCRFQQAELKKARAQQTEASMAKKAAQKLQSYGSISTFEFVKAAADEEMANADVDKLQAAVDKCVIKAPFNGSVSEVMVHSHETVKAGDPLLKIVNTENLEFEIQIPSLWLAWLHVGSMFNVHLNEINKDISAQVTMVNPEIEPVSQSVKIVATITPTDPTLLPGMSGQASFPDNPDNKKLIGKKK